MRIEAFEAPGCASKDGSIFVSRGVGTVAVRINRSAGGRVDAPAEGGILM